MIDREIVEEHLADLAHKVARLRRLREVPLEEFKSNWEKLYAAERALQIAIQNVIDIGAHILAGLGDNRWNEYRDIPRRLCAHGIVSPELAETLEEMIGMRNILVHQYVEVDPTKVYGVIRDRLGDFDLFAQAVTDFLARADR